MPGVYREQPSRRAPEPDARCANDYDEIGSSLLASGVAGQGGGARVANFEYQRKCPNAQNLIAIIGDGPDPDRVCDSKCNLQIEGMGARRRDVLISGQRTKLNVIRADRADGIADATSRSSTPTSTTSTSSRPTASGWRASPRATRASTGSSPSRPTTGSTTG